MFAPLSIARTESILTFFVLPQEKGGGNASRAHPDSRIGGTAASTSPSVRGRGFCPLRPEGIVLQNLFLPPFEGNVGFPRHHAFPSLCGVSHVSIVAYVARSSYCHRMRSTDLVTGGRKAYFNRNFSYIAGAVFFFIA